MTLSNSDRNLLFGFLALQNDFISREDLIASVGLWLTDKSKPLDEILLERESIPETQHQLLKALVEVHIDKHSGDTQQSLAALSSLNPDVREQLTKLGDVDIEKTLTCLSTDHSASDSELSFMVPRKGKTRFRVLRPHAKGGLGEVFVAQDEELNREVALKEIQQEQADKLESRARFVLEAEITGGLEHPGIVPVYGMGYYADGRPFYAMRFVRGDSLKEAVKRFHRANPSDRGERNIQLRSLLGRFVDVCHAIEYAHSRGVLHRDLKPGNIMLGKYGETLVVDWGLAKAKGRNEEAKIDGETTLQPVSNSGSAKTQLGSAIGTPAYMSPEQAAGRLDLLGRESDIYSLGATLYYILTGRPPFTEKTESVLQKVQTGSFPAPRELQPNVHPALEAICLKCMATNPSDRYSWPRELAKDVELFLADEPVSSFAEPAGARAKRWLRKHPRSVAALSTTALAGLVCSVVVAAVVFGKNNELALSNRNLDESNRRLALANEELELSIQAERAAKALARENETKARLQEAAAIRSAAESKAVLEFLKNEVLSAARPEGQEGGLGVEATVRAVIDDAVPKIAESFNNQPLVEASLRDTLGTTYEYLGQFTASIEQHLRARELRETHLGPEHEDTIASMIGLSTAYYWAGNVEQALPLATEALQLGSEFLGRDHKRTLHAMTSLAAVHQAARSWDKSIPMYEEILRLSRERYGPDDADSLLFMRNLAFAYNSAGKVDQLLPIAEETMQRYEAKFGPEHPDTIGAMNALTMAYRSANRLDDAEPLAEKTVELCEIKFGQKHFKTLATMLTLAGVYRANKKLDLAIPVYQRALEYYRETLGDTHPYTLTATISLAHAYKEDGDNERAVPLYEEALRVRKQKLGPDHFDTISAMNDLSSAYLAVDRWEEAIPLAEDALEIRRDQLGPENRYTIQSLNNLANVYKAADQLDKAIPIYEQALTAYQSTLGNDHAYTLTSIRNLANGCLEAGDIERALKLYQEYMEIHRSMLEPEDLMLASRLASVGFQLLDGNQFSAAEPYLRECIAIREKQAPDDWRLFNTRVLLGDALAGQGRNMLDEDREQAFRLFEAAEPLLVEGYHGMKQREDTISNVSRIRVPQALERIANLYQAWDKPELADQWREKLDDPAR